MMDDFLQMDALAVASAVRSGETTARQVLDLTLSRIDALNSAINAFTTITRERAIREADEIDTRIRAGQTVGPLAGVPFAVKNLFDLEGVVTVAGSKIHQSYPPATEDAFSVKRLKEAGAVCVGALNMDEYAYGFTTENSHYDPTRNPHNLEHIAGGSSGGSAAAVAAGMVPLTLGTDTNGSIRVPAAFCGIFGLQATYGRFSRTGALLFAESFDRIGPFARSVRDLALCFDLLQGVDPEDKVCISESLEPTIPHLESGISDLKIARAGGYFATGGMPEVFRAVDMVAKSLGVDEAVEIPYAECGRAAAYIITGVEGGNFHFENLRRRAQDFDPNVRDRFLAGPLVPGAWYLKAQKFRTIYKKAVLKLFETYDVLLAPTTPTPATKIGQATMVLDGVEMAVRPNIGLYTQPLSFIGLPIISVPMHLEGSLPLGVMLVGAPHSEAKLLRVARYLEKAGVVAAHVPEIQS